MPPRSSPEAGFGGLVGTGAGFDRKASEFRVSKEGLRSLGLTKEREFRAELGLRGVFRRRVQGLVSLWSDFA